VKKIKDALGATVNDVMVAALAGSMYDHTHSNIDSVPSPSHRVSVSIYTNSRRYLEYRGESSSTLDRASIRAMVPYAFPRPLRGDDDTGLRNQWCFISMALPVETPVTQPMERLTEAKRRCDALKASPEAAIQYGIQAAMAQVLPFSLQANTALDIMLKHSMVALPSSPPSFRPAILPIYHIVIHHLIME
jgi:hypothetical protein